MLYILVFLGMFSDIHVCWANPTKDAIKKCGDKCNGSGTYGWGKTKTIAKQSALKLCNKEFGKCKIDYCEKK